MRSENGKQKKQEELKTHLFPQRLLCQWILADFLHQFGDSAPLDCLPVDPGGVADGSLEDEEETHPLVVVVVGHFRAPHPVQPRGDARVGVVVLVGGALVVVDVTVGVSRPHEAVGLEHGQRDGRRVSHHAVYGRSEELSGRGEDRAAEQEGAGQSEKRSCQSEEISNLPPTHLCALNITLDTLAESRGLTYFLRSVKAPTMDILV